MAQSAPLLWEELTWDAIAPAAALTTICRWPTLKLAKICLPTRTMGYKIVQSQRFLQTDKVLFCIALIGIIGLAIDYGLKFTSRLLTPWADQTRN